MEILFDVVLPFLSGGFSWLIVYKLFWVPFFDTRKKRKEVVAAEEPLEVEETYGHCSSPLTELEKVLPKPYEGWMWELEVVPTKLAGERDIKTDNLWQLIKALRSVKDWTYEQDSLAIEVRLRSLTDSTIKAQYQADLLWSIWVPEDVRARDRETWREAYRMGWAGRTIMDRFTGPVVTWAKKLNDQMSFEALQSRPGEFRIKAS